MRANNVPLNRVTLYKHSSFMLDTKLRTYCTKRIHEITRKAPRVGANSSSVFAFDMHYK